MSTCSVCGWQGRADRCFGLVRGLAVPLWVTRCPGLLIPLVGFCCFWSSGWLCCLIGFCVFSLLVYFSLWLALCSCLVPTRLNQYFTAPTLFSRFLHARPQFVLDTLMLAQNSFSIPQSSPTIRSRYINARPQFIFDAVMLSHNSFSIP